MVFIGRRNHGLRFGSLEGVNRPSLWRSMTFFRVLRSGALAFMRRASDCIASFAAVSFLALATARSPTSFCASRIRLSQDCWCCRSRPLREISLNGHIKGAPAQTARSFPRYAQAGRPESAWLPRSAKQTQPPCPRSVGWPAALLSRSRTLPSSRAEIQRIRTAGLPGICIGALGGRGVRKQIENDAPQPPLAIRSCDRPVRSIDQGRQPQMASPTA